MQAQWDGAQLTTSSALAAASQVGLHCDVETLPTELSTGYFARQ
jgi:hypothetical protein